MSVNLSITISIQIAFPRFDANSRHRQWTPILGIDSENKIGTEVGIGSDVDRCSENPNSLHVSRLHAPPAKQSRSNKPTGTSPPAQPEGEVAERQRGRWGRRRPRPEQRRQNSSHNLLELTYRAQPTNKTVRPRGT
jgi:hypothetical protein